MKRFLRNPNFKISDLKDLSRDALLYQALPHFFMEIMHKYFRTEVEGLEHLPKRGGALIAPNHSGFMGFDAMMIMNEVFDGIGRVPQVMTHHLWFLTKATSIPANKMGFVEATTANGVRLLKKNHMIVLFPEGEHGNFKPTKKAYQLQEFKRGFVRIALESQKPIIPTVVIGAEETNINLKQLKLTKFLRGTVLPLPLNVLPLPVKWKIKFLPPRHLPFKASAANDKGLVHEIANEIRDRVQAEINLELKNRKNIF